MRTPQTSWIDTRPEQAQWIAHHTPNGQIPGADVCGPGAVYLVSDAAEHVHGPDAADRRRHERLAAAGAGAVHVMHRSARARPRARRLGATSQPARDCRRRTRAARAQWRHRRSTARSTMRRGRRGVDGGVHRHRRRGARSRPPPLRTRAKLAWDEENLYVAAELAEPRVAATIRAARRAALQASRRSRCSSTPAATAATTSNFRSTRSTPCATWR